MKKLTKKSIVLSVLSSLIFPIVGCGDYSNSNINSILPNNLIFNTQSVRNKISIKASNYISQGFIPGEIIVKYKKNSSYTCLESMGIKKIKSIGKPEHRIYLMKLPDNNNDLKNLLQKIKENPNVEFVELNGIYTLPKFNTTEEVGSINYEYTYPNDPMFSKQYAHKVSNSQAGWTITTGNPKVTIAIVDTGVDLTHPDLKGKLLPGKDFVDEDNDPTDGHGHGTHCSGIAAAITNNNEGIAGFAPNCSVLPVRVLDDRGSGSFADVAEGIMWASDKASVISMSLGGRVNSQTVTEAVNYALSKDVVVVSAMGNDGKEVQCYPAALQGVIAVGSTDSKDQRSSFSNYGKWISVTAPGSSILSTFPTYDNNIGVKNYGVISGTSMATPAVAGLAGLVKSKYPNLNYNQIKIRIENGADDLGTQGFDKYFGYGRINVYKTLK